MTLNNRPSGSDYLLEMQSMTDSRSLGMEANDRVLIHRFARRHDGDAFSILMERYADIVYTTCRRILGNEAQAADAAQETFFELVKKPEAITGSLGGWLHRVATRRAVDLIRQNASRRRREQAYVAEDEGRGNSWSEVEPVVDEALEEMPEEQRELLMLHFLRGQSTIRIAAAQGVSQPTISRRLHEALELLRQQLRERGVQVALVPLQTLLLHSNHAAPEALRMALGKIALVKAAAAGTGWMGAASGPLAGLGLKTAVTAALLSVTAVLVVPRLGEHRVQPPDRAPAAASSLSRPAPVAQPAVSQVQQPAFERKVAVSEPSPPDSKPAEARPRANRFAATQAARTLPPAPAPQVPTNQVPRHQVARAQNWPGGSLAPGGYAVRLNAPVGYATFYQRSVPDRGGLFNRPVTLGPGASPGGTRVYPTSTTLPPAGRP